MNPYVSTYTMTDNVAAYTLKVYGWIVYLKPSLGYMPAHRLYQQLKFNRVKVLDDVHVLHPAVTHALLVSLGYGIMGELVRAEAV